MKSDGKRGEHIVEITDKCEIFNKTWIFKNPNQTMGRN